MKGIQFVVDDRGRKKAVILDLAIHGELREDFYDVLIAESRENEPRESLSSVKRRLRSKLTTGRRKHRK